ncbi:hypothetical protein F7D01_13800 [Erythrobacter sp. 3-20A1M]|uniref:hypothetical protein n=1 Tax=Erythrobacter sp. 3-20A1M TaxID=2653850 RepID=UPI001BFC5F8A|nr:hypothetical protein [Erythrobacter sp. 3-20A1M]QWC57996.1 hypothetical protein F7D01_13800 [Erythrobacter sp. 3-20A1M]
MVETIHDLRRRAPLHFWNRAENARACAYVLWQLIDDPPDVSTLNYDGSASYAMSEAFDRESSFAIESILKAAVAAQREADGNKEPPPSRHDVGELWSLAQLPRPDEDDRTRLMLLTEMLYWSARYAAPLPGKKAEDRMDAIAERAKRRKRKDGGMFVALAPWTWDHFERMYQVAHQACFEALDRRPGRRKWAEDTLGEGDGNLIE